MSPQDTRTTPDGEFDSRRLRTITDMERATDDRLLGGVCAGAARYLNIDPVIVRVVIAVLTVVGFSGVILYAAAWFLLPAEGEARSVAADWFKLDKNEEQVRVAGLVGAAALAALAIVGDNGYAWWGVPWFLLPLALLYYLFVVRPRRRRHPAPVVPYGAPGPGTTVPGPPAPTVNPYATTPVDPLVARRGPRPPRSSALSWLTLSVAVIAVAVTRIYAEYNAGTTWLTYVAVALGVVGLGLVIGTVIGHGGPLIAVGMLLTVVLGIGALMPSGGLGAEKPTPVDVSDVQSSYKHGIGLLQLDLSETSDVRQLHGRTIELDQAVGQVRVVLPAELNVRIQSRLDAGEIRVFDRRVDGTENRLNYPAKRGPSVTIDIHQRLGNIEVIRR